MNRLSLILTLILIPSLTSVGAAQSSRLPLRLEDNALYRGSPAEVVEVATDFSPVALSRYVVGDSAIRHARSYERDARGGLWMRFGGGVLMLAGSVLVLTHHDGVAFGAHRPITMANGGLMLSGFGISQLGRLILRRADCEATKSLQWHNGLSTK